MQNFEVYCTRPTCYNGVVHGPLKSPRFSARQNIDLRRARYMLSPVRLSVCLSQGWISQKQLKLESS